MNVIGTLVVLAIVFVFGTAWGVCIERDRVARFPTPEDTLPRATWRQRRAWRRERMDINPAVRRERGRR